jgi:hypothetical protein
MAAMRSPVLRFVACGALLFALQRVWLAAPAPLPTTIVVAAAPDAASIDAEIDEEILFREALARQLDRDRVVQSRLVRLGRYLGLGADGSNERVEREARALGLHEYDPVVRRHLVEMMRIAMSTLRPADHPSEDDLRAHYDRNRMRYAQPARIRFTHVYLSAERRGAGLTGDAADLLAQLQHRAAPSGGAAALGDPFARGAELTLGAAQLDEVFGPGFAAALGDLPERTWSGPVRSVYGEHLIWISARLAGGPAPYAAVRNRILHELLRERSELRLRETLQAVRARYRVRIASS